MILNTRKEFIKKATLIFTLCFIIISSLLIILVGVIHSMEMAIPLGVVTGLFMSLFITAHLSRNFQNDYLVIDQNNRHPQRTMTSYHEDIDEFLQHLRFRKQVQSDQLSIYTPLHRLHIISGDILVKSTMFQIEVQGPKYIIQLLNSQLGLKKILL